MYRFFSSSNVRSSGIGLLLGILVAAMPLKAAFAQPSTNVVLTTVLNLTAYIQQPNASGLPIVKVQRFATKDVVAAIGSDLAQPADSLAKAKLLLQSLAECVQQNLLAIQVSYLIPDMVKAWETIETELEVAVMAFLDAAPESKARLTSVPDRRRRAPRSNRG